MQTESLEFHILSKDKYKEHFKYPLHYNLIHINRLYPGFSSWYLDKMWYNIGNKYDVILCTSYNKIVGVCIVNMIKNKICTLYVNEEFRHNGVGTHLIELAKQITNSTFPEINFKGVVYDCMYPFLIKQGYSDITVDYSYDTSTDIYQFKPR